MKIIQLVPVIILAVSFSIATAQDSDPVDVVQKASEQALELAAVPLNELNESYTGALAKLKVKVQKEGDLQKALKVQSEIENFAKPGKREFGDLPDLQRLRRIYEQNLSQVQKDVHAKELDILAQLAKKYEQLAEYLTKQGNLKDAVRSTEAREKAIRDAERIAKGGDLLTQEEEIKKITIHASNDEGVVLKNLKKGDGLVLEYVSGRWKSHGELATENPDGPEVYGGDANRLGVFGKQREKSSPRKLAVVPGGTSAKPFRYEIPDDFAAITLRIVEDPDDDWEMNPGAVVYRVIVNRK